MKTLLLILMIGLAGCASTYYEYEVTQDCRYDPDLSYDVCKGVYMRQTGIMWSSKKIPYNDKNWKVK